MTVAAVLLAAVGGGVYLLDENGDDRPGTALSPPSDADGRTDGKDGEDGGSDDGEGGGQGPGKGFPEVEPGFATDLAAGVSLPVPKGWKGTSGAVGAGLTTGEHPCPGDPSTTCVRGGVFSAPAPAMKLSAKTPEEAAKKDIAVNAEESYGGTSYGKISSHEELRSEEVTVAGGKGYVVRWKVVTEKGDDGYVESLVFPSPASRNMLVVVRSGFDINEDAPELGVLDEITRGIKAAPGAGGDTGGEV